MANAAGPNQAWGKVRIEALSDGVFAIALTLLVLDLRLPDVARSAPSRDVTRAVSRRRYGVLHTNAPSPT